LNNYSILRTVKIISRSVIVAGGVDLSREARLIKCNVCFDIFVKIKNRVEPVKHQFRKNTRVLEVLEGYHKLSTIYFNNS
jgi:hypothetical protein